MKVSLARTVAVTALLFSSACSLAVNDKSADYVVNTTDGKAYYHLMYSLTADNLTKDEFYQNGGQFEVRIAKESFPISAPNCKFNIILRMPWVNDNEALDYKYDLYQKISALHNQESNSNKIDVAIELNPYVASDTDGIYLAQCNVFFRSKDGQYIDNID